MKTQLIFLGMIISFAATIKAQNIGVTEPSSFDSGFYEGFSSTLAEEGILGNYSHYADKNNCSTNSRPVAYLNDSNAGEKEYGRGYRCGVQQATKAIPLINEENQLRLEERNKQLQKHRLGYESKEEKENPMNETINYNIDKQEELKKAEKYQTQEREREQLAEQNRRKLADMQQRQFRAQQQIHRSIENTANDLNRAFEASVAMQLERELRRRETVANNFINSNIEKVNKVQNLYSRIPVNQFNKVLNGQFKGHVFLNRKYSFLNGEELYTEIPAIINVENDIVKNIYLYEKEGFELKYPMEQPQKSKLNNGLVEYVDMAAYETITVVLVEPYLFDNPENPEVDKDEYGYLSIYAKKKRDDGKTVWIQEIDVKKNQVNREFTVKLKYLKNKKELESEDFEKYPVNTKYSIYYFGEPVQRPFGRIPLFLKVSKKNQKPLKNNEHRIVEIKNYRDR